MLNGHPQIRLPSSVEVMRANLQRLIEKRLQALRLHVNYAILILKYALYEEKFAPNNNCPVSLIKVRGYDHVGNSSLILH
jgi:hypothetical protein